jgi:hypothetical protein
VTSNPGGKCGCFWIKQIRRWALVRLIPKSENDLLRAAGLWEGHR